MSNTTIVADVVDQPRKSDLGEIENDLGHISTWMSEANTRLKAPTLSLWGEGKDEPDRPSGLWVCWVNPAPAFPDFLGAIKCRGADCQARKVSNLR